MEGGRVRQMPLCRREEERAERNTRIFSPKKKEEVAAAGRGEESPVFKMWRHGPEKKGEKKQLASFGRRAIVVATSTRKES